METALRRISWFSSCSCSTGTSTISFSGTVIINGNSSEENFLVQFLQLLNRNIHQLFFRYCN
jgi:hypothetical protein